MLEPLRGHEPVLAGLWRAARDTRLPHALAFEGTPGTGRFLAARRLAAGLLCASGPGPPCGRCGACRRVAAGSHPDLLVIEAPGEEGIAIHHIARRDEKPAEGPPVEDFLSLRAGEGGWRIVLVRDFQRANEAAQNALLKILEEPGAHTLLVLETARPEAMLATIRSRCVRLRFAPLPREEVLAVLEEAGLETGPAALLARWAEGAPGRALELQRQEAPATRALLVELLEGRLPAFELAQAVGALAGDFPGRTDPARARARARAAVELALALLRDFLRHRSGMPAEALPHGDLCSLAAAAAPESVLLACVDAELSVLDDLEANLDPVGALDRSGLCLAGLRGALRAG